MAVSQVTVVTKLITFLHNYGHIPSLFTSFGPKIATIVHKFFQGRDEILH